MYYILIIIIIIIPTIYKNLNLTYSWQQIYKNITTFLKSIQRVI